MPRDEIYSFLINSRISDEQNTLFKVEDILHAKSVTIQIVYPAYPSIMLAAYTIPIYMYANETEKEAFDDILMAKENFQSLCIYIPISHVQQSSPESGTIHGSPPWHLQRS